MIINNTVRAEDGRRIISDSFAETQIEYHIGRDGRINLFVKDREDNLDEKLRVDVGSDSLKLSHESCDEIHSVRYDPQLMKVSYDCGVLAFEVTKGTNEETFGKSVGEIASALQEYIYNTRNKIEKGFVEGFAGRHDSERSRQVAYELGAPALVSAATPYLSA